jgi:hypothetical protein
VILLTELMWEVLRADTQCSETRNAKLAQGEGSKQDGRRYVDPHRAVEIQQRVRRTVIACFASHAGA